MWRARLLHLCHFSLVGLFSIIQATCDLDPITGDDAEFCRGGLHVVYPGIGDVSCKHIPLCQNFTHDLINVWGPPVVTFPNAQEDKDYVLMMVDPDAPSRQNPIRRSWRHWILAYIKGHDLLCGKSLKGRIITEYNGPSPPVNTGYHRYEISLYLQPPGSSPSLLSSESEFRGNFDPDAFALRNNLGKPVATTEFKAKNPIQKSL
ncbi:phosphatidylethanolamine-binding protein 4 isoform X3 [Engystomops pustulosus]